VLVDALFGPKDGDSLVAALPAGVGKRRIDDVLADKPPLFVQIKFPQIPEWSQDMLYTVIDRRRGPGSSTAIR
jgi:hypothetical protein